MRSNQGRSQSGEALSMKRWSTPDVSSVSLEKEGKAKKKQSSLTQAYRERELNKSRSNPQPKSWWMVAPGGEGPEAGPALAHLFVYIRRSSGCGRRSRTSPDLAIPSRGSVVKLDRPFFPTPKLDRVGSPACPFFPSRSLLPVQHPLVHSILYSLVLPETSFTSRKCLYSKGLDPAGILTCVRSCSLLIRIRRFALQEYCTSWMMCDA